MNETTKDVCKAIFGCAAGIGAKAIVGNACKAFMPKVTNPLMGFCYNVGANCLASAAFSVAAKEMTDTIDGIAEAIATFEVAWESAKEEKEAD